jgi:hypothetical protein
VNNNFQADTLLRRSEKVVSTNLDQEVVMMSIERGSYYGLDHAGTDIWEYLAEPKTFQDLCSHLMSRYTVEKKMCESDVVEFLTQMLEEELIEIQ